MDVERILVGVDFAEKSAFSQSSELALASARALAARFGAKLILLHVIPERPWPVLSGADSDEDYGRRLPGAPAERRRRLEDLRREITADGIGVSVAIVEGRAEDVLQSRALELDVDLIALGHRASHGAQPFRFGSVAEKVVRGGPASVLVARADPPGRGGYQQILVPVDFSERSAPALDAALALAAPEARIEVFHRYEIPQGATLPSYRRAVEETTARHGQDLVSLFSEAHPGVTFRAEEGRAARGIVSRLEKGDFDLVVLGSHRRRHLRRWLLGSVAESVMGHAPCSALVVREDEERPLGAA